MLEAAAKDDKGDYQIETLVRVRKQMDRVFDALSGENDPMKLDRLASALARLADMEQKLAMRPSPGSFKPVAPRKSSHTAPVEPDEPM